MNFQHLAELRIEAAMEEGQFLNLPGAGKPLPPIPEGDFMEHFGARLMKEAGALPPEVSLKKQILADAKSAAALPDGEQRDEAPQKLNEKRMKLAMMIERR